MRRWVVAAALAAAACNGRPNQSVLDWDRMRDQPRYDPYERSGYFSDGATMRQPPRGTVPVEESDAEAEPRRDAAFAATSIPIAVTQEHLARGENRYDIFCRPCHDTDGSANSPVAKNMQLRQPPSLLETRIVQLPVGRIYQAIAEGYGLMPAYSHQLAPEERWDVVAYVRALQLRSHVPLTELPPAVRAEALESLSRGSRR